MNMGLLRHGAMPVLFGAIRAPSTLGSFPRSFTWGNVLQRGKVHRELLAELVRRAPAAARQGRPGLHRYRLAVEACLRARQSGSGVRVHQDRGQALLVRGLNVLAGAPACRAARRAGACFPVTVRMDPNVRAAAGQGELFRPGATTRSSPTPRSPCSRPKSSTAATPGPSRSSPTGPTGPWPTLLSGSFPANAA